MVRSVLVKDGTAPESRLTTMKDVLKCFQNSMYLKFKSFVILLMSAVNFDQFNSILRIVFVMSSTFCNKKEIIILKIIYKVTRQLYF